MPVQESLARLAQLFTRNTDLNILTVAQIAGQQNIQRLRLANDLASDFRRIARETFNDTFDVEETTLIPYDPGRKLERNECFVLDLDQHPDLQELVQLLSPVQQAALFTEDEDFIDALRYYCISVSDGTSQGLFLREYTRSRELSHKPGLAIILGHGVYDKLEQKVFLFDSRIDLFVYENYMLIWNPAAFERIFQLMIRIQARADETLDTILQRVPVLNTQEFRNSCKGQRQMLSKLDQIARRPYLGTVQFDDIRRTIETFNLAVEIRDSATGPQLVFDPHPSKRWLILKLLDDNYLGSTMTNIQYEVNSKNILGTR